MKKGKIFSLFMLGAIALGALSGCNKPVYTKDTELANNIVEMVNVEYNMELDTESAVLRNIYVPKDGQSTKITVIAKDDNKPYFITATVDTIKNLESDKIFSNKDGYKYVVDTLLAKGAAADYTFEVSATTYEILAQIVDMSGNKQSVINTDVGDRKFQWGYINGISYERATDSDPFIIKLASTVKTIDEAYDEERFYNISTSIFTNCKDESKIQAIILSTLESIENQKETDYIISSSSDESIMYSSGTPTKIVEAPVEEPQQ